MAMKEKRIFILLLVVILVLSILLIISVLQNNKLKASLPYLTVGEKIKYFDIVGINGEEHSAAELSGSPLSLIFIFNRSCSHCDSNILYWNRMAKIVKDDNVRIFGIILPGPSEMFAFKEKAKVNFNLFTPDDRDKFKNHFRLKIDLAQTILCEKNKIVMIGLGELNGDSFNSFLTKTKNLVKKEREEKRER